MSINGSGLASVWSEISTFSGTVDNEKMYNYLQRYSGGSWSSVAAWSSSAAGTYDWWATTQYVSSGYYYRLKTKFYAYQGNTLLESVTRYTSSVYY